MTQQRGSNFATPAAFAWGPLLTGLGTTVLATAIWIALTVISDGDTTYHLFPLVIGASAALASRYVVTGPLRASEALVDAAVGIAGVLIGWGFLVAVDKWPSATFIEDQPGGVAGETIALALLGAVIGVVYAANWRS